MLCCCCGGTDDELDSKRQAFLPEGQDTAGSSDSSARSTVVTLDDFELLRVVGRGTYGKVMQVRKHDTGELYAMKVMRKADILMRNQVAHTLTERHVLQSVRHPFIVQMHFAFQSAEKLYPDDGLDLVLCSYHMTDRGCSKGDNCNRSHRKVAQSLRQGIDAIAVDQHIQPDQRRGLEPFELVLERCIAP